MSHSNGHCHGNGETTIALLIVIALIFLPGLFIAVNRWLYKDKGIGHYAAISLMVYTLYAGMFILMLLTEGLKNLMF